MPAGARVGTFVHRVLQATDFDAADLAASSRCGSRPAGAPERVELGDPELVAHGLAAAVSTPLRRSGGRWRCGGSTRADRLDELALRTAARRRRRADAARSRWRRSRRCCASGSRPTIRSPGTPSGSRTRCCAASVRGYLTGSIDLVLRAWPTTRAPDRYAIVDYKTNWLAAPDEQLTRMALPARRRCAAEMHRSHYALQALLYVAALHRYLRWRVPELRPRARSRRRPLPVPARDDGRCSGGAAACSPGARRGRSWRL